MILELGRRFGLWSVAKILLLLLQQVSTGTIWDFGGGDDEGFS